MVCVVLDGTFYGVVTMVAEPPHHELGTHE